jgi:hypothetical protein
MRGWWRRNLTALIAVAVLVPATALVLGGNEWWFMYQGRAALPVTAASGERPAFGDAQWGPASVREVTDPDLDIPPGTKILLVEVPVDPEDGPLSCTVEGLRELTGAGRQWDANSTGFFWDDPRPTSCDPEAAGASAFAVPFLVPDDATGPFGLELSVVDELPRYLRLTVVP